MSDTDRLLASAYQSPLESPGFRFWQTFLVWQRRIDAELAPFELTQPTFSLLAITAWLSERNREVAGRADVRQKVVVELSGLSKIQVSQWLRRLEALGLVRLSLSDKDRREHLVRLTDQGWETLRRAMPIVEQTDRDQLSRVQID